MDLRWHPYRYYPYERELALREIRALLSTDDVTNTKQGVRVDANFNATVAERLVYFADASNGEQFVPTMQARLERVNGNGLNRQSTRYSVHGLHEYKGKFNPQIARAILNILGVPIGGRVLDPFCGSGTSLVECSHLGIKAVGTDVNPLAVFIANAKLAALQLPAQRLRDALKATIQHVTSTRATKPSPGNERLEYLLRWFDAAILDQLEKLRFAIERGDSECTPSLLTIASNLLRDYSLQDPHDLRIRRRKSPLPEVAFIEAFKVAANRFLSKLEEAQSVLGRPSEMGKALLLDSRSLKLGSRDVGKRKFDCALTSPPYATALPYIDTQRLSLVWLGLLPPTEILRLEANLIGSREVRGESKRELRLALLENDSNLPKNQADYCCKLQNALSDEDGFRRQAVPLLLYRYFNGMAEVFKSVRNCLRDGAPFALIVGGNHTVLGGRRFDIDTPRHLAEIASCCGWTHEDTVPLQTYQRFGYHRNNAVNSEALVILRVS